MKLKRLGSLAAICLLLTAHLAGAQIATQTAEPDTFPVEQRCVGAPTQPPSDWTYPGMILMSGYAGIHAMQADWDAPRVVAFLGYDSEDNEPLMGGQLSPDQNWYAVPMGKVFTESSNNIYYNPNRLRIYNLTDGSGILDLNLSDYRDIDIFAAGAWTYFPVQWRDNESLIIGGLLLYPFTGAAEASPFVLTASSLVEPPMFSPDLMRAYGSGVFFNDSVISGFYDPFDPTVFHIALGTTRFVFWRPDSTGFIAYGRNRNRQYGLVFYNYDGELLEGVLNLSSSDTQSEPPFSGRTDLQWSPNGNYFAFAAFNYPLPNALYLADWQQRIVIDTCLVPYTQPVWSPDGTMFAYLANASENYNLVVVDTTTWQAYIVARHSGGEMVGWRSTSNEN